MKCLIAEFEEQSFTQIIFPHVETDWCEYLDEAIENFVEIINAIIQYQKCLVICDDVARVRNYFKDNENLFFVEYLTDDTWARDCSAMGIVEKSETKLLDFRFDAWGGKFEATKDNLMTKNLTSYYSSHPKSTSSLSLTAHVESIDFVLEGGAIESNGAGLILTTSTCMSNRNLTMAPLTKDNKLKKYLGAKDILTLHHGYLAGDDTDSHVDTLARFIDEKTIMFLTCKDKNDEHYTELKLMQKELHVMAKKHNLTLIELPMSDAIYFKDERLPATYANFLFVNGAVLVPTYGVKQDKEALEIFKSTFTNRDIIPIDCQTLIKQHGSLHCVSMNFARGVTIQ